MTKAKELPPIELLNEWLNYDPETGNLTWTKTTRGTRGEVAGGKNRNGYIFICSCNLGGIYLAHRIAWALYHQELPDVEVVIDHMNGVPDDNRIVNLRAVTRSANCLNRQLRSDNTSGHRGVRYHKQKKKWEARITLNGKKKYLGRYECIEDAIAARLKAEKDNNIFVRD